MKNFDINNLVRENVKVLKPYSSARDEFEDFDTADMIFLDANENPFENGVNRYPDPQQMSVKGILAKQRNVKTNQILLGNGSDEIIDICIRIFCRPGIDSVLLLSPTYGMYEVSASIHDVGVEKCLLNNDFQIDFDLLKDTIEKLNPKIIFVCSPNNPTGNSFKHNEMIELINAFDGIVVLDEAYIDFSSQPSLLAYLHKLPNLVILQTFSKAWALAGLRLGMAFASPEIIAILNKIKYPYNINILTQEKVLEMNEYNLPFYHTRRRTIH